MAFLINTYPFFLVTKIPESTKLHTTSENLKQQEVTDDDCIITSCSSPEQELSLLELRQQKLLHRSSSDPRTKCNTGKLTNSDFNEIETGALLSDKHITEASNLLRHQFTDIKSLQSPCYGQDLSFQPTGSPFVQILHVQGHHWITIYAVHYGLIFIYDSMAPVISHTVQMQAAAILQSSRSDIVFEAQRMIPQEGVSDCGLFAIAYATDLCIGNNPAAYRYRCNIS